MISVIVPTYNRASSLYAALESVASQTFTDIEVIVVNDGGASVVPVVDRWRNLLPITVVDVRWNAGVSHARNVGLQNAKGDHVAFLDDDDIHLPNHLAMAAATFASTQTDLVYLGAVVSETRIDKLPLDLYGRRYKCYSFSDDFLLVANFIHTSAVVVKNFRGIGVGFDESLRFGEDWDLWLNLRRRFGFRMTFVDALTTIYHQVPGVAGLVSDGQAKVPSPFALTRRELYERWPSSSSNVQLYRSWMRAVDIACDEHVLAGGRVPIELFDRVLAVLHRCLSEGVGPDRYAIGELFHAGDRSLEGVIREEDSSCLTRGSGVHIDQLGPSS